MAGTITRLDESNTRDCRHITELAKIERDLDSDADSKQEVRSLDPPLSEIWPQVLCQLEKNMKVPIFNACIRPSQLIELSQNEAIVAVANDFAKTRLGKEHRQGVESVLQELLGRRITLTTVIDPGIIKDLPYTASISAIPAVPTRREYRNCSLNPKFVFDSFVVGPGNQFSHAASLAVSEKLAHAYNPLFIYSAVGLGKTHLLQAISNAVLKQEPTKVVRYLSCEKFANEVINSFREHATSELRKRFRQVDVLLLDDIQFLEGKEATQEEFIHTFNHLSEAGKQIVLSSDRPPRSLSKLAERLRSRLEGGLIADIQAPTYQTRLAILQRKVELEKMSISDSVLELIADTFKSNIRELEGALLRAHAYSTLTGAGLTTNSVFEFLQAQPRKKDLLAVTVESIIHTVASLYNVEPGEIRSSKRSHDLTIPRHIAIYLAYEMMSLSFSRIGYSFGNRRHTSVKYAYDKISRLISEDAAIARVVDELKSQLNS